MGRKISRTQLPPELDTPAFRASWDDWQRYRKQRRAKLTQITVKRQLNKLSKWAAEHGVDYAVRSLDQSMDMGWLGVFEPVPGRMVKAAGRALTWQEMQKKGLV